MIYIFTLIAILNLFAVLKKSRNLEIFSKVLLMPTLFLSFPFVKTNPILIIVCVLYTLGDAFLLSKRFSCFITGALSFLFGHIAYYIHLAQMGKIEYFVPALCAGLLFLLYYLKIIFKERTIMNYLELIYILFVDNLFILAFSTGSAVMAFGAFLFAFSDMIIVKGKNEIKVENSGFLIMFTYIFGNFALLYGQYLTL